MKAEDVAAEWVEKAARAAYYADPFYRSVFGKMLEPREVLPWDELDLADIQEMRTNARHALAAVLPEIQAQAQQDLITDLLARHLWPVRHDLNEYPIEAVPKSVLLEHRNRLARLTATTEEPAK